VDFGIAVSDVFSDVEVQSMKLPKSVPGVNRGMSALSGYNHQVGVEPSPPNPYYTSPPPETCRWVGTAPFCSGQCAPGEVERDRFDGTGNLSPAYRASFGGVCITGTKAKCCKPA